MAAVDEKTTRFTPDSTRAIMNVIPFWTLFSK